MVDACTNNATKNQLSVVFSRRHRAAASGRVGEIDQRVGYWDNGEDKQTHAKTASHQDCK